MKLPAVAAIPDVSISPGEADPLTTIETGPCPADSSTSHSTSLQRPPPRPLHDGRSNDAPPAPRPTEPQGLRATWPPGAPEVPLPAAACVPLRVLDLFSGIGGMHHALLRMPFVRQGLLKLEVTAVDINSLANRMYAAEFGVQPRTLDLTRITAAQLDDLAADLWLLTPPCQPYTTGPNARRRDTADPRASALLRLISAEAGLPAMRRPPARLLLENVPGFVGSDSHALLRGALEAAGYDMQEFIVSPHQLGVPYSRPRYFALALRRPLRFFRRYDCGSGGPIPHPPSWRPTVRSAPPVAAVAITEPDAHPAGTARPPNAAQTPQACSEGLRPEEPWVAEAAAWPGVYDAGPAPGLAREDVSGSGSEAGRSRSDPGAKAYPLHSQTLSVFLESAAPRDTTKVASSGPVASSAASEPRVSDDAESASAGHGAGSCTATTDDGRKGRKAQPDMADPWFTYAVPAAQLRRFWRVLDVVTPSSTYCNCFTKHYADNVLGAGSLLASEAFAARFCARDIRGRLHFSAPPPLPLPQPASALQAGGDGASIGLPRGPSASYSTRGDGGESILPAADGGGGGDGGQIIQVVLRPRRRGNNCVGRTRVGAAAAAGTAGRKQQQEGAEQGAASFDGGGEGSLRRRDREGGVSSRRGKESRAGRVGDVGDAAQASESADEAGPRVEAEAGEYDEVVYGLRFFTPPEVAAIHGLAPGWDDLARRTDVQIRQQYSLLGNGLSTDVAAHLLQYLFADNEWDCGSGGFEGVAG